MERLQPWWRLQRPYGMLGAATTLRSPLPRYSEAGAPLPAAGREATNRAVMPAPKVTPLPVQIFIHSKTLVMACANFTFTTPIWLTGAFRPVLGRKTNLPLNNFRFGGVPHTCHCHCYAFPCKRWLDFFDWRIDQWQVFGWYWSNLEHCSLQVQPKFKPIWSPSQRGRWAIGCSDFHFFHNSRYSPPSLSVWDPRVQKITIQYCLL